ACNDIIMLAEGRIVFSGTIGEFDGYLLPTSIVLSVIEEHAAEEIALMPQVLAVESMGGIRYRVKVQDVDEMLEVLIQESVQKKWRLKEIHAEANNMEAIFAELSGKK